MVTGPRTRKMKNILIGLIGSIVLFSIVMRILNVFIEFPFFIEHSKDVDFILLLRGLENGLINFYDPVPVPEHVPEWPPYYLYFWYFIFFPMGLFPFEVSVVIWNILSGTIVIYICLKCYENYDNLLDVRNFYAFLLIGFLIDIWYGNSNFLILLFLFLSYEFLERDQKWLSGVFFTLATFKINAILFIPFLLLSKKIKLKELYYYITPFVLICLPYIIFPDYLLQMLNNWTFSDEKSLGIQGLTPLDPIIWKALQPSHLLYISYFYLFYMEHFEENNRRKTIRRIIITGFSIYYAYITLIVFIIPISLSFL